MLRAKTEIAKTELSNNWIDVRSLTVNRLKETFQKYPSCFFTEHDIHSVLYNIAKEELQLNGVATEKTRDGHRVLLVHHEYPTPFRCYMKGYNFELRDYKPYKRGHYDLVILNPKFVKSHKLDVLCGKDCQRFKSAMKIVEVEPLIWACEIIFFPGVKKLPKNALKIIEQDALKVKETLRYRVGQNVSFCKIGSTLVFAGHTVKDVLDLKWQIARLSERHELEVTITALPNRKLRHVQRADILKYLLN